MKKIIARTFETITEKVRRFEGLHNGESCYIIGDGPSIKWFDLKALKNYPIFTLWGVQYHNEIRSKNWLYGMNTEPWWFYPLVRSNLDGVNWTGIWRNRIQNLDRRVIAQNKNVSFFVNLSCWPTLCGENIHFLYRYGKPLDYILARDLVDAGWSLYNGSLNTALYLSIFMGFKRAYLVGCDYTFETPVAGYWYLKGDAVRTDTGRNYNKDFFDVAKNYIDIITVTRDGGAPFLKSVTFEEHTGTRQILRANTDLLVDEVLSVIESCPKYRGKVY